MRYSAQEIDWDVRPAIALADEFTNVPPRGRALDLGCGQGRNAVWLAEKGWRVTAVDYSSVAIDRARRLAKARAVEVNWIETDVTSFIPDPGAFQLVLLAYLQIPRSQMRQVLAHSAAALAPGGTLFMVGHARINLTEGTGGPRDPEVLWEPRDIEGELAELGLVIDRVGHVYRTTETPEGPRTAIDTVARAERN